MPQPASLNLKVVPKGEQNTPEFAPCMPKIMGGSCVVIPFTKARIAELKAGDSALIPEPAEGEEKRFISSDDVVSVRTREPTAQDARTAACRILFVSPPGACLERACRHALRPA